MTGSRSEEALLETTSAHAASGNREAPEVRRSSNAISASPLDSPKWQFRRLWAGAALMTSQRNFASGELFASGYQVGAARELSAIQIPSDRWRILKPDFRENSAADDWVSFYRNSRFPGDAEGIGAAISRRSVSHRISWEADSREFIGDRVASPSRSWIARTDLGSRGHRSATMGSRLASFGVYS